MLSLIFDSLHLLARNECCNNSEELGLLSGSNSRARLRKDLNSDVRESHDLMGGFPLEAIKYMALMGVS